MSLFDDMYSSLIKFSFCDAWAFRRSAIIYINNSGKKGGEKHEMLFKIVFKSHQILASNDVCSKQLWKVCVCVVNIGEKTQHGITINNSQENWNENDILTDPSANLSIQKRWHKHMNMPREITAGYNSMAPKLDCHAFTVTDIHWINRQKSQWNWVNRRNFRNQSNEWNPDSIKNELCHCPKLKEL